MSSQCKGLPFAWFGITLTALSVVSAASQANEQSATPDYSYSLKQLGAKYPMTLRGVEGSDSVNFDVRSDRLVTKARLNLEYSYSPALLSDLSQINVLINDQVATSIPVPKEQAGSILKRTLDIPPYLITEFNHLRLQLIGHYTMSCEDPLHSSLWAKIDNRSLLELQLQPIDLPNDLALLPRPFFDRRDASLLALPFVFAEEPDARTLEAAATVSSWFGALASYRGAKFPVNIGQLPKKGNAVVVQVKGGKGVEGIALPEDDAPRISLLANPHDAHGKLLIISGHNGEQLKQAALALVSGYQTLSGSSVQVTQADVLTPRKPYDAPNWLPSHRPVQLGELIEAKKLSVSGYDPGPISIGMRLPPDLFDWRREGIPLHLKYRYTPQPVSTNSSLLVTIGGKFIKSLPLFSFERLKADESLLARLMDKETLTQEHKLMLPLASMPLQSELELRFMYDYIKQGECRDVIVDNMRGAIEPDSTLDLSEYEHFIAMPNLGVFQSSGFPFTRLADLSETAVVIPEHATTEELGTLLTVLGRFGDSTGLPASGLKIVQGQDETALKGRDLLVFGSSENQPLLTRWAEHIPAHFDRNQQQFSLSDLIYRLHNWLSTDDQANQQPANTSVTTRDGNATAYLAGFESPLDKGRSVVVIASNSPNHLDDLTNALIGDKDSLQSIQGSLAVINGKQISSLVAEEQYFVGDLTGLRYCQWILSRHVGWSLLLTALGVACATLLLFLSLRARARARLSE